MRHALVRLGLIAVLAAPPAQAAGGKLADAWPQPTVGYSADMTLDVGGETMTGKVFAEPGRQRQNLTIGQLQTSSVLDFATGKMLTWSTALPVVVEVDLAEQGMVDPRLLEYEEIEVTPMGPEEVNGIPATKHAVRGRQPGGSAFEGFVWLTVQNIPVRIEGTGSNPEQGSGSVEIELSNLETGDQDDALFAPPAGASKFQLGEVLQGLQGLMGQGAAPAN